MLKCNKKESSGVMKAKINTKKSKLSIIILTIIVLAALVGIGIIIYNKSNKNLTTEELEMAEASGEIIKIEKFKYDTKEDGYPSKKIKEKGYIIYKNGLVIKYDNIKQTKKSVKTLGQEKINEIIELADKIDETKVTTINTDLPISSGTIIIVHNSNGKEITIKDAYSDNYSEASEKIKKLLDKYNLI